MTVACEKAFTLTIPAPCGASTDWSNPGSCRLRVKDFNAADWVGWSCPDCNLSGNPVWNGEFSVWVAGQVYNVAPGFSLDGKELSITSTVSFIGGFWRCIVFCVGGIGGRYFNGTHAGATPIGTYLSTGFTDCLFSAKSLDIEAYSL